jgi:HK97 family phage major capsid protein
MADDSKFLKDNLQGFVPTPTAADIITDVTRGSSILRLSKVQPMASETLKVPVMVSGPGAYWVGETERIQTSVAKWIFPELTAKKIGVIIPVSKEKLNDTTIDVFATVRPYIAEAFYKAIDAACLFGTNSPFAKSIYGVANAASRAVKEGTNAKLDLDISDVMALVENEGLDVNGFVAGYQLKNSLRKLRDSNGNQLFVTGVDSTTLYSQPIEFCRTSSWDNTKAEAIAGNWSYSLVGIRDQIQYEVLREATLQTVTMADDKPLSLAENDMVAIKATMRLGFLPVKENAFAVLTPKTTA